MTGNNGPMESPLVDEVMRKAAVVWLTVPAGGAAYPVWCLWIDGALYVVSGPGVRRSGSPWATCPSWSVMCSTGSPCSIPS